MEFHSLEVSAVDRSTENTVTLSFELPAAIQPLFRYQAGQFLTLRLTIDGETLQRAYSLNSSPAQAGPLQITVRAVADGRASRWLNDNIQAGDCLDVAAPMGTFCPDIQHSNHRSYFLFAAGSGITPLLAIARTVLAVEPWSYVYLLYGSRDEHNIVLRHQVETLAAHYPDRMTLVQTLSQPLSKRWSALWKDVENWQGETGRITPERVQTFIQQHPPAAQQARYLICGPGEMIQTTRQALEALDVDPQDMMVEAFSGTAAPTTSRQVASELRLSGTQTVFTLNASETLLEGMIRHQLEPDYSCQSGVCGCCRAELIAGQVEMAQPAALSDQEIENGAILLCQARACSEKIRIDVTQS